MTLPVQATCRASAASFCPGSIVPGQAASSEAATSTANQATLTRARHPLLGMADLLIVEFLQRGVDRPDVGAERPQACSLVGAPRSPGT